MKEWTLFDDARILSLLSKGWTRKEIAADFGVTRNAICGKIHRLVCKPPKEDHAVPDEETNSVAINPLLGPYVPALPPPALVKSTTADYLDEWHMKQSGQPYKANLRKNPPGSYVGWLGLMATTCGKVISVDRQMNSAFVEWYVVDDIFHRPPPSCLCRWSDLYPASPRMVARATARDGL